MRTPLPTRRLVGGVPCALLALLLVFARLLAPAMAMPQGGSALAAFDQLARESICHVPAGDDPAKERPAGHGECLLCPACHLADASALPAPPGPALPPPGLAAIGRSAPLPPATGPPSRRRTAAHPTGPPSFSA